MAYSSVSFHLIDPCVASLARFPLNIDACTDHRMLFLLMLADVENDRSAQKDLELCHFELVDYRAIVQTRLLYSARRDVVFS